MNANRPHTLQIDPHEWGTPYQGVRPQMICGKVRISRHQYRGLYKMNGVLGYEYFHVPSPGIPVHALEICDDTTNNQWKVWMVDDPLHWIAMGEYCKRITHGWVVCAGLGLGLMLHHLYRNRRIERITVIERNPLVIRLMKKFLPLDQRVELICQDFYEWLDQVRPFELGRAPGQSFMPMAKNNPPIQPDFILWDLGLGNGYDAEVKRGFIVARARIAMCSPKSRAFYFGHLGSLMPRSRSRSARVLSRVRRYVKGI